MWIMSALIFLESVSSHNPADSRSPQKDKVFSNYIAVSSPPSFLPSHRQGTDFLSPLTNATPPRLLPMLDPPVSLICYLTLLRARPYDNVSHNSAFAGIHLAPPQKIYGGIRSFTRTRSYESKRPILLVSNITSIPQMVTSDPAIC
ncbi:hypothetical protein BS47DRAFT_929253 [Hydnum rufescens UP504]|uniref:Uncharacterized protein n=1 Tax=Hydnum rufescens UP504 TaxID=1448309 RepID=A0A9P6AYL6_9AGAM|nr:hypothetical protein BS47DRAFT_929253 [Hydnum rufescens UP504]